MNSKLQAEEKNKSDLTKICQSVSNQNKAINLFSIYVESKILKKT